MKTIRKQILTTDRNGRPLARSSERLVDDGRGRIQVLQHQTSLWCAGCRRPVENLAQLRGRCDCCRAQAVCEACETRCQTCSRRLCFACRRGFAGATRLTVCPVCLVALRQRQAFEDRQMLAEAMFRRRLAVHREWQRVAGLRLQSARIRAANAFQIERLRTARQMAVLREVQGLRLKMARARAHVLRSLQ